MAFVLLNGLGCLSKAHVRDGRTVPRRAERKKAYPCVLGLSQRLASSRMDRNSRAGLNLPFPALSAGHPLHPPNNAPPSDRCYAPRCVLTEVPPCDSWQTRFDDHRSSAGWPQMGPRYLKLSPSLPPSPAVCLSRAVSSSRSLVQHLSSLALRPCHAATKHSVHVDVQIP